MITATCTTTSCRWQGVPRNVIGEPNPVICGECDQPTALTDPRPDPTPPPEPEA